MPAGLLEGDEAEDVAEYLAKVAGQVATARRPLRNAAGFRPRVRLLLDARVHKPRPRVRGAGEPIGREAGGERGRSAVAQLFQREPVS